MVPEYVRSYFTIVISGVIHELDIAKNKSHSHKILNAVINLTVILIEYSFLHSMSPSTRSPQSQQHITSIERPTQTREPKTRRAPNPCFDTQAGSYHTAKAPTLQGITVYRYIRYVYSYYRPTHVYSELITLLIKTKPRISSFFSSSPGVAFS